MPEKPRARTSKLLTLLGTLVVTALIVSALGYSAVRFSHFRKEQILKERTAFLDKTNTVISETPLDQAQKVEGTVSLLSAYLAKYPDDARAHRLMAIAYDYLSYINYDQYDAELLDAAHAQILQAMKYDPKGWKNQSLLITNFVHKGEFEKAKAVLAEHENELTEYARLDARMTIARDEKDWPALVQSGEALLKLASGDSERRGMYEVMLMGYSYMGVCAKEKEINEKILKISDRAYDKVHYADYFSRCEKNYGEAVHILREVFAGTDTPAIRYALSHALSNEASAEVNAGKYSEAKQLVKEALEIDPVNDHAKYVRDYMNGTAQ